MKVGSLEVTALSDGYLKMPTSYLTDDAESLERHKDLIGPDGMLEAPVGCFLIRNGTHTVLIDAGLGPLDLGSQGKTGELPAQLEAAGCKPDDIDVLIFTHLHLDHIGWSVQNGELFFPNAKVYFGVQDLDQFMNPESPDPMSAPVIEALQKAAQIETLDHDGEIVPGVGTLHAPGHTLGHRCIVLSSGEDRAILLGDAISCPQQLDESSWGAMSDIDKDMSARTREALWRELESTGAVTVGAHFPGLQWGRVLVGEGKRYFS